jgi:phage terminase large subunit GpA-like protein
LKYRENKDPDLLQVFVNQTLGETYDQTGRDINAGDLANKIEAYINTSTGEIVDVPEGALCLTAGVDVQADRLEVSVDAWGVGYESWGVDYKVFPGNTDYLGDQQGLDPSTGQPTVWKQLDLYLQKRFQHAHGVMMPIECTLIDSQFNTKTVQEYCRFREGRRIYPSHGKGGTFSGFYKRPKKRHDEYKTWLFTLYVDHLKDRITHYFQINTPGPGYCHWAEKDCYNQGYFNGLTVEKKVMRREHGQNVFKWENPPGGRNEPFDTRIYSYGAVLILNVDLQQRATMGVAHLGQRTVPQKKKKVGCVNKGL